MASETTDYENGLRDGKIQALEDMQSLHHDKLVDQETRIRSSERIQWGLLGAIVLVELFPTLKDILALLS